MRPTHLRCILLGVVPDFTTLPSPKHIAHAPISAPRYFSSEPATSQEVLNVWVANRRRLDDLDWLGSWPRKQEDHRGVRGVRKYTDPSGITLPAQTVEKLLPSASLTLSINGVDYVTNKNIVSLDTSWKNNIRLDAGFFPGSGFQTPGDGTTGAVRGRLEFGNRVGALKFVARFDNNSTEYAKLKAQTTGTAVITLTYDANNSLQITWQKMAFATVEITETDQFATVAVDCTPIYDSTNTNGLITAVAKCNVDAICQ
jgi:hypothetical protein